jgi:hypothetical protein
VLPLSKSSLSRSGMFLACPVGPAAEPGMRSNDMSRVSRTESCVTDCHDSGRNCGGSDGVKGEGASCAECECECESRGSDDWPAVCVARDKEGGSGRGWAREVPPRSLLLVSIVEEYRRLRLYLRVGTSNVSPRLAVH